MLTIEQLADVYYNKQFQTTRKAKVALGVHLKYPKGIGCKAAELDTVLEFIDQHPQRAEIVRLAKERADAASASQRDTELFIGKWKSRVFKHDFVEELIRRFDLDEVRFILETITRFEK